MDTPEETYKSYSDRAHATLMSLEPFKGDDRVEPYYSDLRKACFNLAKVPDSAAFLAVYENATELWKAAVRGFAAGEEHGLELGKIRSERNR